MHRIPSLALCITLVQALSAVVPAQADILQPTRARDALSRAAAPRDASTPTAALRQAKMDRIWRPTPCFFVRVAARF